MQGKTRTFSRVAGIVNVAAAVFLALVVVFFFTVGNFGILTKAAKGADKDAEEGAAPQTEEEKKEEESKAWGFVFGILLFLPLILILLVPLGIVDFFSGLVMGTHCLKAPPKTGAVIYSLILKILTVPAFSLVILLLIALGDMADSSISALFPALIGAYVITLIVAHVFEWLANRSAKNDLAAAEYVKA